VIIILHILDKTGFKLINIPKIIKTYHYDKTNINNKDWKINENNNLTNSKIIPIKNKSKYKNVEVDLSKNI
jgi:hypothetical protein